LNSKLRVCTTWLVNWFHVPSDFFTRKRFRLIAFRYLLGSFGLTLSYSLTLFPSKSPKLQRPKLLTLPDSMIYWCSFSTTRQLRNLFAVFLFVISLFEHYILFSANHRQCIIWLTVVICWLSRWNATVLQQWSILKWSDLQRPS